jgi:hypothetical protein
MNTITEARVREVLGHSPLLTAEDYAGLTATANSDPEEGPEWLPYYKLHAALLMQAFGAIAGAADAQGAAGLRFREIVCKAKAIARLSLRLCAIGPDETSERAAEVDALIEQQWPAE